MSFKKKGASHYNKAITRLAALKSISQKVDVGNGVSIEAYETAIQDFRTKLNDYNTTLSIVDEKRSILLASEKNLKDFSERMLTTIASLYSKDSTEYLMAGGVKKSERKKRSSTIKKEVA